MATPNVVFLTGLPQAAGPYFPINLRTWTSNYNQLLIGRDLMPARAITLDAPPASEPSPRRSWTWQYILNLIARDAMPAAFRKESYELPQRPYPRMEQTWAYTDKNVLELLSKDTMTAAFRKELTDLPSIPWRLYQTWVWQYNLNLIGQDRLPTGAIRYDLTPIGYPRKDQTWAWQYNLNLIGQDRFPTGAVRYDRPSVLSWYRDWYINLQTTTLGVTTAPPFAQFDWPAPRGQPRQDQTWSWQYNLNLIGLDLMPARAITLDATPVPSWYRDWSVNLQTTTLGITTAPPFAQFDWPTPRGQPRQDQTWSWQYNLNLIGLDILPTSAFRYDLTPIGYPRKDQTWSWQYNLNLIGLDVLPTGAVRYELAPIGYPRKDQTWTWQYNLNLIGLDILPTGAVRYELTPIGYPRKDQTWSWQYNLNLIGLDVLPTGAIALSLPAVPSWYRDWSQNLITSTLFTTPTAPFAQFDWPLTRAYPRQDQTYTFSAFIPTVVLVAPTPFAQYDWPLPMSPPLQLQQRGFTFGLNQNLPPPVVVTKFEWIVRYRRRRRGTDQITRY
jgi:hypothetical protein